VSLSLTTAVAAGAARRPPFDRDAARHYRQVDKIPACREGLGPFVRGNQMRTASCRNKCGGTGADVRKDVVRLRERSEDSGVFAWKSGDRRLVVCHRPKVTTVSSGFSVRTSPATAEPSA
jgi:hypothetical protein